MAELLVKKRKGKIAPYINGWNVWDLDPKHWTEQVKHAILHAYVLGITHQANSIRNWLQDFPDYICDNQVWPEPEEDKK